MHNQKEISETGISYFYVYIFENLNNISILILLMINISNMKKFVSLIFCFVCVSSLFASVNNDSIPNSLLGSWRIDNIVYTFEQDTLIIDEIGNEGDCYLLDYTDGVVFGNNEFSTVIFEVKLLSSNRILIKYEDAEPFVCNKINNYDFYSIK